MGFLSRRGRSISDLGRTRRLRLLHRFQKSRAGFGMVWRSAENVLLNHDARGTNHRRKEKTLVYLTCPQNPFI
jgi:hypothetical protein